MFQFMLQYVSMNKICDMVKNMTVLGIDSSGMVASAAVLNEETVLAEYTVNHKKTHSQTLLPMIDEIISMLELNLDEITAVATAGGPGSFTGLRIGASTVKGLAGVLKIPVISVPTLEGLAYNMYGAKGLICPIMDARRNQVYTGIYRFENDKLICVMPQCAVSIEELCLKLGEINRDGEEGADSVVFLGDGVPVFRDYIEKNLKFHFSFAPPHLSRQRAASVAALGITYLMEGKIRSAEEYRPEYLRMSQAERERGNVQSKDMRKLSSAALADRTLYFRTMEQADIEQVIKIEQESFSMPWLEKDFIDAIANKNNLYVVACRENEVVAYCGIWGVSPEGQICNVAVKPECRKAGIAFSMLDCAIKEAQLMGISEFTLEVREKNLAAISLYEKLGFRKEGVRKDFYQKPLENGVIMWKR